MNTVPGKIPNVIAVEGLDFLGKSTLIQGIRNTLGYYQVMHFSKPEKLDIYCNTADGKSPQQLYQEESFRNSMILAKSGARIIFDRWHLGEYVYAPLYRSYDGSYVFTQEKIAGIHERRDIRLILLTEDFSASHHFVDDGESLGPVEKRLEEQNRFIQAFERSSIKDKRIICVTNPDTGAFRSKQEILKEALT